MSDLLPCPFCGGDASHYYRSNPQASGWQHDVDHWVCCDSEDCWATMGLCESKKDAAAAWNRRALPAVQPDAELAIKVRDIIRRKVTFNDLPHTADLPDGTTHTGPVVDYLHDLLHLFLRVLDDLIDKPAHVNETPKREHVPDDVLTRAAKGGTHD